MSLELLDFQLIVLYLIGSFSGIPLEALYDFLLLLECIYVIFFHFLCNFGNFLELSLKSIFLFLELLYFGGRQLLFLEH